MRERFTLVLKGHLALARDPLPGRHHRLGPGRPGPRAALDCSGLDYDHGTGHGVGATSASTKGRSGSPNRRTAVALQPGMIVSNEPGYYKAKAPTASASRTCSSCTEAAADRRRRARRCWASRP